MASIDYAWSIELKEKMTALEAHEKWCMGLLSDKTKFECLGDNCHAQITCVNMDKQTNQMKMREHFKVYGQHSEDCDEVKENLDVRRKYKLGVGEEAPTLEEEITFSVDRLNNHKVTQTDCYDDDSSKQCGVENKLIKKETEGLNSRGSRKSHLYLLGSLVTKYLYELEKGDLVKTRVNMNFSNTGMTYSISLDKLFMEIKTTHIVSDKTWKTKVYFGKANIRKSKQGEYWITFKDNFCDDNRQVCGVLNDRIIDNTLSKKTSKNRIDGFLDRDNVYCFLLGKLREKKTEYI